MTVGVFIRTLIIATALVLAAAFPARSQTSNADCLACHDNPESNEKPRYARFNYAETTEYWAMMWGTIVMAITGLMIWYAVEVATWIPRWWIDVRHDDPLLRGHSGDSRHPRLALLSRDFRP